MDKKYSKSVDLFKAFADSNRLAIIDMLSCGELCACEILERLSITQPTLSHHMKILSDCKLVNARKDGKWMYYSLNYTTLDNFYLFFRDITTADDNCICK